MEKIDGILYDVREEDIELLETNPEEFWRGVTIIDYNAFYMLNILKKIEIPYGIQSIGASAFQECTSLEEITLPDTITTIEEKAFFVCNSLKEIVLPKHLTNLGWNAFYRCESLEKVVIHEGINTIQRKTFYKCKNLKTVLIPKGVRIIQAGAFTFCESLKEITLPEGIEIIDVSAFRSCVSLEKIVIPNTVKEMGGDVFADCVNLREVTLSDKLSSIKTSAFKGCSNLKEIDIPMNIKEIESEAFSGCVSLEKINLSVNLLEIGNNAFTNCESLRLVKIPYETKAIRDEAFSNCVNLEKIEIPDSIIRVGKHIFKGCNFKYAYKPDGEDKIVFSRELPSEKVANVIDLTKLGRVYEGFDQGLILKKYIDKEALEALADKLNKNKFVLPYVFVKRLLDCSLLDEFEKDSDLRFLKSEPNIDLTQKSLYSKISDEEKESYYKFMYALGCFSKEKMLDKHGRETEVPFAQKATGVFSTIINSGLIRIGEFHKFFANISLDTKPNQEFLKFISQPGDKKKLQNLELLLRLDKTYQGIFVKVMENFDRVKSFRTNIDKNGKIITRSWEEAFKKFYIFEKYKGITPENRDIADVYGEKGLSQEVVDEEIELRKIAKERGVSEHILGKPLCEKTILESIEEIRKQIGSILTETTVLMDELYAKRFTYEMLSKYDPRNGILGIYASCCATIKTCGYGEEIARSSIIENDVQNIVVKDSKGEIIAKGTMYVNAQQGYGVINDFEINKKYKDHELDIGKYCVADDDPEELERDAIFDAFMRGIHAFIKEYDKQHPDNPIEQINVGMGYNRLKAQCERYQKATKYLTVPTSYGFMDALDEQYILYSREDKEKTGGGLQK